MLTDGVTVVVTDMVIAEDVAVVGEAHGLLDVSVTLTWSPSASVSEEKVFEELFCTETLFTKNL